MTDLNGYQIATKFINSKIDHYTKQGKDIGLAHSYALGAADSQLGSILIKLEVHEPEVYKMIVNEFFSEDV